MLRISNYQVLTPLPDLESRLGLESGVGNPALLLLDGADKHLDGVVAAGVPHALEAFEDPGGLEIVLVEEIPDDLVIGIKVDGLTVLRV